MATRAFLSSIASSCKIVAKEVFFHLPWLPQHLPLHLKLPYERQLTHLFTAWDNAMPKYEGR